MRMHNPPHPGQIIRQLCLEPLAVRLSIAFGTSSESWMNEQTQHDLWHAEKRRKDLRVSRVAA